MQRQSTSGFNKTVDLALFCVLCLAPFFLGGRYPIGRLVYVVLAATAAIAWTMGACFDHRTRWHRTAGTWIILLGLALVVIQVVPLPSWLIAKVSPTLLERIPLWSPGSSEAGQLGLWSQVSLAPQETIAGAAIFLAYSLLFLVACQRMHTFRDVERMLGWIALSAIILASVGLVQYVVGTDKYLGFYKHPFRSPKPSVTAAFYNGNHFAHMLALGIGPLVWWLAASIRVHKHHELSKGPGRISSSNGTVAILICIGTVLFAGLMSTSRGGMLVIVVACITVAGLYWSRGLLPGKVVAALGASAIIVTVAITIHGFDRVAPEIEDLTSGSVERLDNGGYRRAVWSANMDAIPDFWILGAGIGAHRHLLPTYLPEDYGLEFTHSESGYLQIALEAGIGGVILCCLAIAICFAWCWRAWWRAPDGRYATAVAAVSASLLASVVHSVWDFVWFIPATMSTTAILAACACRLSQLACAPTALRSHPIVAPNRSIASQGTKRYAWFGSQRDYRMPAALAWCLLAITVAFSLWMVNNRIGPALGSPAWDQYLLTSVDMRKTNYPVISNLKQSGQEEAWIEERATQTDAMITFLKEVLRHDPQNARAHLRLAGQCLVRFEIALDDAPNRMPLSQIRDAAIASQFPNREALDEWLSRAIGPSRQYLDLALRHARRGTALCPFAGDGYLYLSDLCFLEGRGSLAGVYLDQARRVRPHDGDVLLRIGTEAWLCHDVEKAVQYWHQAYHTGKPYQMKLIQILGGNVPVEFFLQVFGPDLDTMQRMEVFYLKRNLARDLAVLRQALASRTETAAKNASGLQSAQLWYQAYRLYVHLESTDDAIRCGRQAVQADEYSLDIRKSFGRYLLTHKHYAEAEHHLKWCAQRNPLDATLSRDLNIAMRGRLRMDREARTPIPPRIRR
ncbi:MAG: O-antigen ligase family protein [Pirellulales bacterium]|nr:O-antigen ligase family protein [Pirellulales bacterium]